jgi:pimeloyl-ACP methyl ester carboxylesterase
MPDSPSIVLVHGAWHGAWAWAKVEDSLRDRGFDVNTVSLPSAGEGGDMYEDSAVVRKAIDAVDGSVVVVAHSYGGVPTTQGAFGADNLQHIVYLTSFMLDEGESLLSFIGEPPEWSTSDDGGRTVVVKDPTPVFYNDCSAEDAAEAGGRLRPHTLEAMEQPVTAVAWRGNVPTTYVICEQDNAIPLEAQEVLSQRASSVKRLDASHSPFLSMPDRVVDVIVEAGH